MASAGSPYRLVPAHFYPWLYITPHMPSYIPTKWRTYRDHRFCDVISPHVYHRRSTVSLSQWSSSSVYSAIPSREFIRPTWYLSYVATVTAGYRAERFATCCHLAYASHWAYLLSTAGHVYYVSLQKFLFREKSMTLSTPWVNKKQDTKLLPITSPNNNWFSQFFRWQTQW